MAESEIDPTPKPSTESLAQIIFQITEAGGDRHELVQSASEATGIKAASIFDALQEIEGKKPTTLKQTAKNIAQLITLGVDGQNAFTAAIEHQGYNGKVLAEAVVSALENPTTPAFTTPIMQ